MRIFSKKRVFLDHAAATPLHPEVKMEMKKYAGVFYNPSSIYEGGVMARKKLEECRTEISRILKVQSRDIVFTGSGTEADNLAVLGIFEAYKNEFQPHIIVSSIEHPAILEAAKEVERRGGEVTVLPVDEKGTVSIEKLREALHERTVLVSVMYANNETGAIEPVARIGREIRKFRKERGTKYPYFHTDASQAANYLPLELERLNADLLTLDSGKVYGPKGIGLLAIRPNVTIAPIMFGGGQERGLRPGTENFAAIAGFAKALLVAERDLDAESKRVSNLKQFLIEQIKKNFPHAVINTPSFSLPHIVSVSFPGSFGEFLAIKLDQKGFLVSTGSACSTGKDGGASTTIEAMGRPDLAESTLRISMGRSTTSRDVKKFLRALSSVLGE